MDWEGITINFAHRLMRRAFGSLGTKGFTGQDRKMLDLIVQDLKALDPAPIVQDAPKKSGQVIELKSAPNPEAKSEQPVVAEKKSSPAKKSSRTVAKTKSAEGSKTKKAPAKKKSGTRKAVSKKKPSAKSGKRTTGGKVQKAKKVA